MAENAYLTPEELRMKKELFFLIYKLLANSECQRAANALREEIELYDLLPKRIDWLGNEHSISLEEMERNYSHIKGDHLLKICSRICEVIDKEIPPAVPGVHSLLGDGSQSLLRRKSSAPRLNACSALNARVHGAPLLPSVSSLSNYPSNIVSTLIARQNNGPSTINHTIPTKLYSKQQMHKRQLGHLSSVYCITFDRSGKYIITGADDLLVKIWSATDARLLATLRGHAAEITDLSVNYENTLLAAGSCDKMIRVWCLKTTSPVCILTGHTGQITSLKFCPLSRDNNRYLISTANDGCVCFWRWNASTNEFQTKPIKFNEKTKNGVQLICSSFSGGGAFLAVGSTDHCVRVYHLAGPDGPEKILEIEAHADQVDSLQFSNLGFRFVSGSKDGTASIWWYERQTWRSLTLNMNERLPGQPPPSDSDGRVRVNMVCWTCDDAYVITAVSDNSLKVWDSNTAKLIAILNNHEDDVFVVEAHPTDPRVFLSGGHDGRIILWDVVLRSPIKVFLNQIEGQGHGAIFDCKFSPDGQFFASTDSHGHITIYGFGSNERYKKVPKEVFFHTDYRPLIRDAHHYVIDEQTQCAPHLMPPPFLVDIDGNPYEPIIQRLVPGRENCNDEQLVPYISIQNERGIAEVLEPVSRPHDENQQGNDGDERPTIDYMIERLQQEQDRQRVNYEHGYAALPSTVNGLRRNNHSQSSEDPLRRVRGPGDVEGVRQSSGSWQSRDGNTSTPYWTRRIVVKPLHYSYVIKLQQQVSKFASLEEEFYFREQKRKPLVLPSTIKETLSKERVTRRKRRISQQRLGVVSRNNTSRSSRNTQNRRHSGIIDYENPEDLSTPEESGSNFSESAADSWEESSSESESESEEEEDDGWNFGNDAESSRRTKVKENKKFNGKRPKKTRRNDDSSSEGASSSKAHEESDSDSAHHTNHSDSDVSLVKVNSKVKVKPQIKITKYPDWLICVYPKRSPYFPQIGDEVVYIRVAHEHYLETVRKNKEYKLHARTQAVKRKNMKEEQLVKVTNIKYQLELSCSPIVLAILTLVVLDDDGKETNETFTVRYHDMPDVLDFLVLKQIYEDSIARDWKVKDRFKSIIDDKWWFGTIVNKEATKNNSYFQSLRVLWDSKEEELMSPWDLEQIDQHGDVKLENEGIPVSTNDRTPFYTPKNGEWPEHGMDYECDRIISGLEKIMETSWAEHFSAPVDLNKDCDYASLVPYPIDLSTIKARLENRMYRRLDAVKFDVNFIEHNAKASNEKGSDIRVKARLITTLCLRFIDDFNCDDPYIYIQEISQNKEMYESTENEDEENINGETSRNGRSSRKRKVF
ncbi:bromodomain and WD repeat-containing protein 3-like protein [Dinothrombium tinctorium]|uniref:Bromodomain and WD repeat-containing protein 3-like protein n=1 Tax=Dinothrombium tinctorium TaxID=1965070 RepID=A0A3S3SM87_9ACAR|nr:bromodomain and WD repeat-containing protein 3-like protein [Dinothrombium tinctorium]